MRDKPFSTLAILLFLLFSAPVLRAEESKIFRDRLGLGVTYVGAQIRYRFLSRWAAEMRYLTGHDQAREGTVNAKVMGLRLYRFFPRRARLQYYLGGEGAVVKADQEATNYSTSGTAFGAFGGLELRLGTRFSFGLDAGPYVMSLDEDIAKASNSSFIIVVNSYINFFIF